MSHEATPEAVPAVPAKKEGHHESAASVIAAIAANVLIGIVKFIAAGISGSSAMVSEGIHSFVDSGNGLLVLLGIKRSQKKPDAAHPFGYGKELYFWTLVVAVMIFALGGGFSLYEGVHALQEAAHGSELGDSTVNYIVLLAAGVIEGFSLSVALRTFNAQRGTTSPLQFIREAKDPSLYTIVLEDSAAELGIVIALLGVFAGHLLNNPYLDGIASMLIGLLLCSVAIVLLRETKGLLIGEGLRLDEIQEAECIVEGDERVLECGRILSLYFGPHDLLLAIDATFKENVTQAQVNEAVEDIETRLCARFPQVSRIFVESECLAFTSAQALNGTLPADERAPIPLEPRV